jgi:glycosyltransferase involved in cell wall biosynthesis
MLVRELNIQEHVRFLGKQLELVPILSAADLFLMPSQSESFGLSALEAMSCGVPVVSSSVGGLPELQVHGETGYIAEIGDVERMARYAIDLLGNEARHAIFSTNARKRAVEHFDIHKIVAQYEAYLEQCLGRRNSGCTRAVIHHRRKEAPRVQADYRHHPLDQNIETNSGRVESHAATGRIAG